MSKKGGGILKLRAYANSGLGDYLSIIWSVFCPFTTKQVNIRPFLRTNNLWKSRYIAKNSNSPYYKKENVVQTPSKPQFVQHFSSKAVYIPRACIWLIHKFEALQILSNILSFPYNSVPIFPYNRCLLLPFRQPRIGSSPRRDQIHLK